MRDNEIQSAGNIRNSPEFETALAEANKDSILVTLLKISEEEGRFHLNRLVKHVTKSQELMARQEVKNHKSVEAKQGNSKVLDFLSTGLSFMSGLAGGPMSQLGATLQAAGQGFQSVSSMEGQIRQGKGSNEDFQIQRLEKLFNEDSSGKQGADKGLIDCRQAAKTALDAYQQNWNSITTT